MLNPGLLLAQLPESNVYINPWGLLVYVLVFIGWALFAQWVDKDTVAVNTFRVLWNLVTLGVGAAALLAALLIPIFWVALPVFVVLNAALMITYVVHRNGLVEAKDRVMTAEHFARIKAQGFSGKKKPKEVKERVRLLTPARKVVTIPEGEAEREQYRLTQELLFDSFWRRAMVVEVSPAGQATKVQYSIDGVIAEREPLQRTEGDAIISFLKGVAGLSLEEKRKPQSAKITAQIGENKHPVVVRTDGSTAGEKLTLRVLGDETRYKVADLGFTPKQLENVRAVMDAPKGLTLLSGPRGSGLTTSIYSFVRSHDAFLQNIQLLEYTKELEVENVTQLLFAPSDDKTFAGDLQKITRTDPDMIILPEVRDRETALIATKATAEKQKMYVAVPADDVFDALKKWLQLVGDRTAAVRTLQMVTSQRLVRKLCISCKQPYKPDPAMLKKLNLPTDKVLYRQPEPTYDKHGNPIVCQACQGSGYVGRTGVFDVLMVDDPLRDVIRRSESFADVQAFAIKRGGVGLQAQALEKVLEGVTSIQEVLRVLRGQSPAPPAGAGGAAPQPKPKPRPEGAPTKAPTR